MNKQRLKFTREILVELKLDALLVSDVASVAYLTDYFNFSSEERECYLLITQNKQFLLTDGRYIEAVKRLVPNFQHIQIASDNPYQQALRKLVEELNLRNLGVEERDLRFYEYKKLKPVFKKIKDVDLSRIRTVKELDEFNNIKLACNLADQAFEYVVKKIRVGVSEKELAAEFEIFLIKNGGSLSFDTIVAFGENSAIPHHATSDKKLKKGDFVLIDCGAKINGYCSDMTRTFVHGAPSKTQENILKTVKGAQDAVAAFIRTKLDSNEKISGVDADRCARTFIKEKGFIPYSHGLGHGVGIKIHEAPTLSPRSEDILSEGMVFSIEPGIYIPGFGGVRIEDTFAIKNGQLVQLTKSPKA